MDNIKINILSLLLSFYCCSLGGGTLLNRTTRQSCGFECSDGGCIDISDVCNGQADCKDGSDESPAACDCGVADDEDDTAGLNEVQVGQHPWHVGIFRSRLNNQNTLLCSGALIYSDIVLTSANCVFNPETFLPYSTSDLHVAAGKLRKQFTINEKDQQIFQVFKVSILTRYEGDTKGFARNLAILKLKANSVRTRAVRPICIWSSRFFPNDITKATITGWGLQSTDQFSTYLRQTRATMMEVSECIYKYYDPVYQRFITNDKLCLTLDPGVSIKEEDNGGPVTILKDGRHYLRGIMSVKMNDAALAVATKVSKHVDWIRDTAYRLKQEAKCWQGRHFNCVSDNACIPLNLLCNGEKDCADNSDENPTSCTSADTQTSGNLKQCTIPDSYEQFQVLECGGSASSCKSINVPSYSAFTITCPKHRGFARPNTTFVQVLCNNGSWFPPLQENKCLKLCPPPDKKSLSFSCFYQGSEVSCSEYLKPNTQIRIGCKLHFKKEPGTNFAERTFCRKDGELRHDLTDCVPVCGKEYKMNGVTLISEGVALKYPKFPWHVALYWKEYSDGFTDYKYQCGGTLIDTDKVLTAAHCIWDQTKGLVKDAFELAVACGKYHSNWIIKDHSQQKIGVKRVIPGVHYNGGKTKHAQDIAVLVLSHDVDLSDYIMPVCLDLDNLAGGIPPDQLGTVVGWGRRKEDDTESSDLLWEAKMGYLDLESCRKRYSKSHFDGYLHSDKFCALYTNGAGTQKGDSGGGLTFVHNGLYYVYGIVSIKQPGQNEFAAFTSVTSHSQWLKNVLNNKI